jgi:hypothetical protein
MKISLSRVAFSVVVALAVTACPPPTPTECIEGDEDVCDAGTLPPDFCNSPEEAEADSVNCHLTVTTGGEPARKSGVYLSRLPDGGRDQDWYFAQLPGLTPRSLLHVNGGYSAPQTAVNFSLNVLTASADGGLASIATAIDRRTGGAAPRPVDIVMPFSQSNAKLFLLVADELGPQVRVDNRNPYSLFVEVIENPDVNEPNDTTPTAIPLSPMGGVPTGTQSGYLATNDDVDLFSFQVTGGGRQIIYLKITGPNPHPTNPPPPYRLSYVLYDPSDSPIAEGEMDNAFLPIDLTTARLAPMTGTYKLRIAGYRTPNSTMVIPGDLRVQYQVSVQLFPDLDTQEPNDTPAMARPVSLNIGQRQTITGKIAYVADEEWFLVSLPSRASPSTLRYRFQASSSGGRFAPLSSVPTRQLRVFQRVTMGATTEDRRQACRTNQTACPKAYANPNDDQAALVNSLCDGFDPPLCLWAQRNEEPQFANLKNHVGALPVPINQANEFLVMVRDEGRGRLKYADDRDWTLELEWRDDPDEAARQAGPAVATLTGSVSTATGELTFGHGRTVGGFDINRGTGIRGPLDYDAWDTDSDLFRFDFGSAMGDQGWELSWELQHVDGGSAPPGEITLELTFCDGPPTPGGAALCQGAQRRILAYSDERLTPWYLPQSFQNAQVLFSRTSSATSTTYSALSVGCWCFSERRVDAGSYFVNVVGVNRLTNDPIRYALRQRLLPYPYAYSGGDGGTGVCPGPGADAGCRFAQ